MASSHPSTARRWLYGLLFGLGAVLARASLQPLIGDQMPFLVAFPAAMIASVLLGWQAGALSAMVTAVAVALPQVPPNLPPASMPLQLGGFVVGSVLMAMFCGRNVDRRLPAQEPPDRFETPLSSWLRAVLWGAFLLPVMVFVVVAWWGYQRALRDAEATVTHAVDLAYRHAQRSFQVAEEIARRVDEAAQGDDASVRGREAAIHQRLADIATGVPSVVNLNVFDAQGRPLVRSDQFPVDVRVRVDDRPYFRALRGGDQAVGVSEVIQGRQSGRELTNATIRRSSPDGSFNGVIAVSLSPGYFRDYYQSLAREQPNLASFFLIRLDGEIIARWPPSPDGRRKVSPDSKILEAISAGVARGVVDLPSSNGREPRIAGFRRLASYPLYVVAGVSREAMFAGWARFAGLLAAVLLPTSAGLVYVTWVALKKTQREAATAAELQEQIRRRASAEQSMLQSQKLETLAVVTGGVAHDFNNLLAIVAASLHVLKRQHPGLANEKQVLAMTRAIQSGVRLTRQLLSFTRKQALKPETVELQGWLPATEGLIRSTLGANITWEAQVAPDTLAVNVDVGELELALINLVVNARHAMPAGGSLAVHAANVVGPAGDGRPMVVVAVTDTGTGIAPELLGKVFEPFFTTRSKGKGSGLGLSQVQGFCTQAGGMARIESVVGQGTTVSMFLPAVEAVAAPEPVAAPSAIRLAGQVLLVEDNDDVGATTEGVLLAAGLQVVRRANAASAMAYLGSLATLPDAVLSDIAMPGTMDGIGLAFELRGRHPGLPVLLTTGYTEHLQQAVAGGLRVLPKPVAPEELLAELAAVIKRKLTAN
jgi:two-component system NtrC family sensor kinase